MEKYRLFIAIKFPVNRHLHDAIYDIKSALSGKIKWIEEENLHLTLKFLGDTKVDLIPGISLKIQNLLYDVSSFKCTQKGFGVFRSVKNPRIIWAGVNDCGEMKKINNMLEDALQEMELERSDNKFNPHITIGRIKHMDNKELLETKLNEYKDTEFGAFWINEIVLYRSILTTEGPKYEVVEKFKLNTVSSDNSQQGINNNF